MDQEEKFIHPRYQKSFVQNSTQMIFNFIQTTLKGQNKVTRNQLPENLSSIINFKIQSKPQDPEQLIQKCQQILQYSVKTYNPGFFNTLYGGYDQYSMFGSMMIPFVNNQMYTYEMSPCFTLMEKQVYEYLRNVLQWEQIDGTMTPGGSFANFMGIQVARSHAFPEIKKKGAKNLPQMKVITSQVSHYSIKKGVILLGIGTDNIILTKTDELGRMNVQHLQEILQRQTYEGSKPIIVIATVGTTVEGGIDELQKIGQVCQKHKVWLHVDACYGGVFLVSKKFRQRVGCFKKVDSIVWDPHKGLPIPLQASFFLCRIPGIMQTTNSVNADYLFHKERASYSNNLDQGNKVLQCGRIADILKVWTYFKGNGLEGVEDQIEKRVQLVRVFRDHLSENQQQFKFAISESQCFNVCFWVIPKKLKKEDWNDEDYNKILNKTTVLAKKIMLDEGKIMIGYSSTKGSIYFWRIVFSNPFLTREQLFQTINLLVRYCEQAYQIVTVQLKND